MQTMPIAKSYIDGLSYQEFANIRALKDRSPDFYQFLANACSDPVVVASFAVQCKNAGIPEEYTKSPDSLHYLVVAINNRASGNS